MKVLLMILPCAVSLLFPGCGRQRPAERCHLFRRTASDPVVTAWDVEERRCTGYHIRERVDTEGRVVELRFMDGDSLYEGTAYVAGIVRYEYGDSTIVETAFLSEDEPLGAEIGAPFRATYRVEGHRLLRCRDEYVANAFAPGEAPPDEEAEGPTRCPYVTYYLYSRAKLGGINPTAEGFDWDSVRLPYDEAILRADDYEL